MKKLLLIICLSLPLVAAHKRSGDDLDRPAKQQTLEPEKVHVANEPGSLVNRAAAVVAQNLALYENADIVDDLFPLIRDHFFDRYRNEILKKTKTDAKLFEPTTIPIILSAQCAHFTPDSTKWINDFWQPADSIIVDVATGTSFSLPIPYRYLDKRGSFFARFDVSRDSKYLLGLLQHQLFLFDIAHDPSLMTRINLDSEELDEVLKSNLSSGDRASMQGRFIRKVNSAFISTDNQYIVVVINDGMSILLFDIKGNWIQTIDTFQEDEDPSLFSKYFKIDVSPDRSMVAIRASYTVVRIVYLDYEQVCTDDVDSYKDIEFAPSMDQMHQLDKALFSPDSSKIFLMDSDPFHAIIYDLVYDKIQDCYGVQNHGIQYMEWIDNQNLLAAYEDVGRWGFMSSKSDKKYESILYSIPDGISRFSGQKIMAHFTTSLLDNLVAVVALDKKIHFFDSENYKDIGELDGDVDSLEFSPNGRYLAVSRGGGTYLYDFQSQKLQEGLARDPAALIKLAKELNVSGFKKPIAGQ